MLTEFNGEVALSNTSICPLPSPDFSPSVTTTTLDNLDAILDAENAQARLDNMRAEIERRAENLGPGLAHFFSTAFHTSGSGSRKSSVLETIRVFCKQIYESWMGVPETQNITETEMPQLKSAMQPEISSDSPLWPENSAYKKIEVGQADCKMPPPPLDASKLLNLFQSCLENPDLGNRLELTDFTEYFKDQISSEFVFNFLVALMRQGFSNNLEVSIDVQRYFVAVDMTARFYDKMTDMQRLALTHYAITAGNRDFFACLAHAQSLPKNQQITNNASEESLILNDLIARMKQNPDDFNLFSQNLMWENRLQTLFTPFSVTFQEEKFKQFITPCYEHIKGDDKKSFELCMNTARLEGFERKAVKP